MESAPSAAADNADPIGNQTMVDYPNNPPAMHRPAPHKSSPDQSYAAQLANVPNPRPRPAMHWPTGPDAPIPGLLAEDGSPVTERRIQTTLAATGWTREYLMQRLQSNMDRRKRGVLFGEDSAPEPGPGVPSSITYPGR